VSLETCGKGSTRCLFVNIVCFQIGVSHNAEHACPSRQQLCSIVSSSPLSLSRCQVPINDSDCVFNDRPTKDRGNASAFRCCKSSPAHADLDELLAANVSMVGGQNRDCEMLRDCTVANVSLA
jgi:hypothetical protein